MIDEGRSADDCRATVCLRTTPLDRESTLDGQQTRADEGSSFPHPPAPPLLNALLLGVALCGGLGLLFAKGRLSWPPTQLLASVYTVAGCLAMIGPILLHRRDSPEVGLGELLWMAGGLVVWVFDLAALTRGRPAHDDLGHAARSPADGPDDAGRLDRRMAVPGLELELVLDERDGMGARPLLGRDGRLELGPAPDARPGDALSRSGGLPA